MRRRLRGLIGVTATTVAIAAIGVVVAHQPAGAGPLHGNHPGAVDQQQAQAIQGQIGITGVSEFPNIDEDPPPPEPAGAGATDPAPIARGAFAPPRRSRFQPRTYFFIAS